MSDSEKKKRPEFRNVGLGDVLSYKLPLPGVVSILHRISGVLIFLGLPLILLPFWALSLDSLSGFNDLRQNVFVKLLLLVMLWAFMHHLCAGIRFLLLDMHKGIEKYQISKSAASVFVVSLALTGLFALKLFGVF